MQVARKSKPVDLMAFACELQRRFETATTIESRKEKGQVFTPASICRYMAGLFTGIPDRVRLLDAGAGIGSLAAAFCERHRESLGRMGATAEVEAFSLFGIFVVHPRTNPLSR